MICLATVHIIQRPTAYIVKSLQQYFTADAVLFYLILYAMTYSRNRTLRELTKVTLWIRLFCQPFSVEALSSGQGAPAITDSISDISRGTFVMFLQPVSVTSYSSQNNV